MDRAVDGLAKYGEIGVALAALGLVALVLRILQAHFAHKSAMNGDNPQTRALVRLVELTERHDRNMAECHAETRKAVMSVGDELGRRLTEHDSDCRQRMRQLSKIVEDE